MPALAKQHNSLHTSLFGWLEGVTALSKYYDANIHFTWSRFECHSFFLKHKKVHIAFLFHNCLTSYI